MKTTITLIFLMLSSVNLFLPQTQNSFLSYLVWGGLCLFFFISCRLQWGKSRRIKNMMGGFYCLLLAFIFQFLLAIAILLAFLNFAWVPISRGVYLLSLILPAIIELGLLLAGYFLVLLNSKHLRVVWRILLITCWWVPLFNIYLFAKVLLMVKREQSLAEMHHEVMQVHVENQDCATRYPIILVHGIFFRDWQLLNYWGRIPNQLTRCGAKIYLGEQQSAARISDSATELAATIRRVAMESGSQKVNIIAHSKGGLDCRYAISKLDMAPFVASLTTVSTPHHGCVWAREMQNRIPHFVLAAINRRYNSLFKRLGDRNPNFLGGVYDLTDTAAVKFNAEVLDSPEVCYLSTMSVMKNARSAPFPLRLTHRFVKRFDGEENDGLVSRSSAVWGEFLGEIRPRGRRGISHCDMIDLTHEDIDDFDASAYYASLVRGLKERGF